MVMRKPFSPLRLTLLVSGIVIGIGIACGDIGEVLLERECFTNADCGPLNCVIPNPNGLNAAGLGWCLEQSTCVPGEQPYCVCGVSPGSSDPVCLPYDYTQRLVQSTVPCWDGVDPNTCLCLPPGVTCSYNP
ncbi:MAG: hypothetical protein R6X02_35085 [Enhygromyxa sp.]